MNEALLRILRTPAQQRPLRLEAEERAPDGTLRHGVLRSDAGESFEVRDGVPRFLQVRDASQGQVKESFGFKWHAWAQQESQQARDWYAGWISGKYGFAGPGEMAQWMRGRHAVLDAGCGSGETAAVWLGQPGPWANYVGLDISSAVDVARRHHGATGASFVQGDVLHPPFAPGSFDTVFSEGVLHHTPSTREAILALAPLLRPGGQFLFYVYARKGPVREFADDWVRRELAHLSDEAFLAQMAPLTRLAQALHETGAEVDVPEAIPWLGIPAGRQSVQRLVYWSFLKAFWNPAYSFDKNNLVNFDWYRPAYAHRQTPDEVQAWCREAGLAIRQQNVEPSGITVRAEKVA